MPSTAWRSGPLTRFLRPALAAVLAAGVAAAAMAQATIVDVVLPDLSPLAREGQVLFGANCSGCHGENGSGSEKGPPLIHPIYEPSHHADMAFVMAIRNGTRAHHWPFGDMPPVEGLNPSQIQAIITFVREVQVANGIE